MSRRTAAGTLLAALLAASVGLIANDIPSLAPEFLTAGAFTTPETRAAAFSLPIAMLDAEQREAFAAGKEQFNEAWVVAPDPDGVWGLGPTFNEDRCARCHRDNGRSAAPANGKPGDRGFLVRLSIPGTTPEGGPLPHPHYGDQLQNRGIDDRVPPEGQAVVHYTERIVKLADGEEVSLRVPRVEFRELRFGELGPDTLISPRVAPAMIGLGLLEAVPEADLRKIAESQPAHGISGRLNIVWDVENELKVIGRFGWKANQPNLRQQTAAAFHGDIGATTYLFPEENCPPAQTQCLEVPSASKCGGQGGCTGNTYRPEVIPSRLSNITLYLQALAVPARRNPTDPAVQRGEKLFAQAKCAVCHVPELRTGPKHAIRAAANLAFRPYTDLLLHDMGDDLADGRPDFLADGREWRTAPLWGVGVLPAVNQHMDLLHDGRARNVTEAILWHGGEAKASRDAFAGMSREDRAAMVRFVESL